jgi:hypothetical protein
LDNRPLTVAEFMSEARAALAVGVSEESLAVVGRRLSEVSQQSGFLPDAELTRMHGSDSTATVLQTDPDGLTLVLGLFSAKQETADPRSQLMGHRVCRARQ